MSEEVCVASESEVWSGAYSYSTREVKLCSARKKFVSSQRLRELLNNRLRRQREIVEHTRGFVSGERREVSATII